ncbi:hypothetical protein ET495_03355 [Xylanimonas allomyrinae]|uniref:Uncharacterized protein n=1 Tax=Xylanimonas allomyrinae TaxID=2509459 RepID=A0A4P6EIN7_9MICO|nr:hypothetical protein [Xylanimonas allomyrinae]QAY62450.1 hypothetical protein ET495_03355 [Xylanimonas allomyrinae]
MGLFLFGVLADAGLVSASMLASAGLVVSVPIALVGARVLVHRKQVRATHLVERSVLAGVNGRKTLGLVVAVVVGWCSAAVLLLDVPGWTSAEWLTVILAIPAFWLAGLAVDRSLARQFQQPKLEVVSSWARVIGATALVVVLALLVFAFAHPGRGVAGAEYLAALSRARNGLVESPSALVGDVASIGSQVAAIREHLSATAARGAFGFLAYVVFAVQAAIVAVGVAGLFEFCRLPARDFRRVFEPVAGCRSDAPRDTVPPVPVPVRGREVAIVLAAYMILLALTLVIDRLYAEHASLQVPVRTVVGWLDRW